MSRYDRSWTTAVVAIALGGTLGIGLTARGLRPRDDAATRALRASEDVVAPVLGRALSLDGSDLEVLLDDLRYAKDPALRRRAARAAGDAAGRSDAAAALMIALLTDEDDIVRANSAVSLGRIGGATAIEPLAVAARGDAVAMVRGAAALALGRAGRAAAIPPLLDVLRTDASAAVRQRAAEALAIAGSDEGMWAVPGLAVDEAMWAVSGLAIDDVRSGDATRGRAGDAPSRQPRR